MTRRMTIWMLVFAATAVGGCGSTKKYANRKRPPLPVNLTVYVNDARVSVSPAAVGAGPAIFFVTNQSSRAESIAIQRPGGQTLASTGPITPEATAQIAVNLNQQGEYMVATTNTGNTDAALASATTVKPARLLVGARRPRTSGQLLSP